jgi:hypothetical protein
MAGHSRLASDLDEVFQHCRSRDANLGDYNAASAKPYVVANLDKIIEPRAGTNYGILDGPTIYRRIGANFNVILNNYSPELRDCQEPIFCLREAEAFLPSAYSWMQADARSEQRVADADVSTNPAILADYHVSPDACVGTNPTSRTNLHGVLNAGESSNFRSRIHNGTWGYECCRMDSRIDWSRGMKQCGNPCPTFVCCRCDDRGR